MIVLCSFVGLLALSPAPALAGPVHVFGSSFGAEGSGPGQFEEPSGVAVNEVTLAQLGDVYVVDTGNSRVEWFSAEGAETRGQFDGSETPAASFSAPTAIAIDNSTNPLDPSAGDLYVLDAGHQVVDKFDAAGSYLGQISAGSGGAPLGEIDGVGVDAEGVVWVYQASREIDSYSNAPANAFLASVESASSTAPGFTVDTDDNLYVNKSSLQFAKLASSGSELIESVNAEEDATAAAVDSSNNDVYIDEGATIGRFASTGAQVERFGSAHLAGSRGVAVQASSGLVYAADHQANTVAVFPLVTVPTVATGEATNLVTEGAATLNGTVNPEGLQVSSCKFEYGPSASYGSSAECSSEPGAGASPVSVSTDLAGLSAGRYHFRLVAANVNGEAVGGDHTFIATARPVVSSEALVGVGGNTATVIAQVNPNGLATTYQVEYGTSTEYGSTTPQASVGAGLEQAGVQIALTGLSPNTLYNARVLASNERGSVKGAEDVTFTTTGLGGGAGASSCPNRTLSGFSPSLPDCRAYEDVSNAGGPGDVYVPDQQATVAGSQEDIQTERAMRAAELGAGVAYVGEAGESGGSGQGGNGAGNQFLATRSGDHSHWQVTPITPQLEPEVLPSIPVFETYSSDLSVGIFAAESALLNAAATPQGPAHCYVLYARGQDGALHSLFTETQTPGSCGEPLAVEEFGAQPLLFAGENKGTSAVAPGGHLLFESPAPLAPPAKAAVEGGQGNNLYESTSGTTRLVSILPGGEPDANAVFGGPPAGPDAAGRNRPDFANAISADGSRIFWTDLTSGRLYMRVDGASTVMVSAGSATFWDASSDGRYAFYTEGGNVYRFDAQTGERGAFTTGSYSATGTGDLTEGSREVTSLATSTGPFLAGESIYGPGIPAGARIRKATANTLVLSLPVITSGTGVALAGGGAEVQGLAGASEDGSYVYFVAGGALTADAENRNCQEATFEEEELQGSGEVTLEESERLGGEVRQERRGHLPSGRGCNLYVRHGGVTSWIAALSAQDNRFRRITGAAELVRVGVWQGELGSRVAQVADGGRELVFQSTQPLTGYDNSNLDELNGLDTPELGGEVFVYDAGAKRLLCASCDPTGAPPVPEERDSGTYLPISLSPTFMRRWVSADGSRVFFASSQPLVSWDTNRVQDVYEWERAGSEGCPVAKGGGCVFLLSGGDSSDRSFFVDASADGGDVFFTHRGQLAGIGAPDPRTVLFDARVNGGFAESSLACTGTGCQGVPPASPSFATPPSATFNGGGNYLPRAKTTKPLTRAQRLARALRTCRKHKPRHKRAVCERQARKRYGPVSAKANRRKPGDRPSKDRRSKERKR